MSAAPSTANGGPGVSGVQELIDQIRGKGVQAAREEGDRIIAAARKDAAATKAKAEAQAKEMIESATERIEAEKVAAGEAIRNAARDSLLDLRNQVRQAFEDHVRRLVSQQLEDTGFVRNLVLVLAGEAASKYVKDQDAEILVSTAMAGAGGDANEMPDSVRGKIANAVLGASASMLRKGITLMGDEKVGGGARVRLADKGLEIDMTEEALSRLMLKHLLPRYQAIVREDLAAPKAAEAAAPAKAGH